MKTKLFIVISTLLLSACGSFQSTPTTSSLVTTTTVDLGSDCNKKSYDQWLKKLETLKDYPIKDMSKATYSQINEYVSKYEDVRFFTLRLSLNTIDYSSFIESIDQFVEDMYYYHFYGANDKSAVQVNLSSRNFQREAKEFIYSYKNLCYEN